MHFFWFGAAAQLNVIHISLFIFENMSASSGWLLKASSIMRADASTPRIS
jgi:hypothetical protein